VQGVVTTAGNIFSIPGNSYPTAVFLIVTALVLPSGLWVSSRKKENRIARFGYPIRSVGGDGYI